MLNENYVLFLVFNCQFVCHTIQYHIIIFDISSEKQRLYGVQFHPEVNIYWGCTGYPTFFYPVPIHLDIKVSVQPGIRLLGHLRPGIRPFFKFSSLSLMKIILTYLAEIQFISRRLLEISFFW